MTSYRQPVNLWMNRYLYIDFTTVRIQNGAKSEAQCKDSLRKLLLECLYISFCVPYETDTLQGLLYDHADANIADKICRQEKAPRMEATFIRGRTTAMIPIHRIQSTFQVGGLHAKWSRL